MQIYVEEDKESVAQRAFEIFLGKMMGVKVLGLATGNSFVDLYSKISDSCQKGEISLNGVRTFNLDEYFGNENYPEQSFRAFMDEHLFGNVDLDLEDINFPDCSGNERLAVEKYDRLLDSLGPIDLQLLGVGVNGHIAFNEPGTDKESRTHVVELSESTVSRNKPPSKMAITMGIRDILNSRAILLVAFGKDKASAIYNMTRGEIGRTCPASFLRYHEDIHVVIDREAASLIQRTEGKSRPD